MDPKMDPKKCEKNAENVQLKKQISLKPKPFQGWGLLKTLTSKMPSRWPKNGPKMTPKWFQIAQIA